MSRRELSHEICVMQIAIERDAFQIPGGELKCGPRKIDSPVVADLRTDLGSPHLSGIATCNIQKIDWIMNGRQRSVQRFFDFPVG